MLKLNTLSEIIRSMLRLLPLLLSTVLLLHPCIGGGVGDALGDVLDSVNNVDDTFHKVKNGVEAAQTELALAAVLGNMFNSLKLVALLFNDSVA